MASARPPQLSDARVPCPLCGGLIHPVAGRCKHCKQDLTQFRAGRPQAATQLPSLLGNGNGHTVPVPVPVPMPESLQSSPRSQPVLPPRPTGHQMDVPPAPSIWRHWPIFVMSVAVVAIVIAVIVLVWPASGTSHAAGKGPPPPPAPERMETDPLPAQPSQPSPAPQGPTGQLDPWGGGNPTSPQAGITPRSTPDPLPADPPDDTDALDQPQFGNMLSAAPDRLFEVAQHVCGRATQCGNVAHEVQLFCATVTGQGHSPGPDCAAKQRCVERVDATDCSKLRSLQSMLLQLSRIPDCVEAMTSC